MADNKPQWVRGECVCVCRVGGEGGGEPISVALTCPPSKQFEQVHRELQLAGGKINTNPMKGSKTNLPVVLSTYWPVVEGGCGGGGGGPGGLLAEQQRMMAGQLLRKEAARNEIKECHTGG